MRGVRKMWNNPADIKVREGGRRGGVSRHWSRDGSTHSPWRIPCQGRWICSQRSCSLHRAHRTSSWQELQPVERSPCRSSFGQNSGASTGAVCSCRTGCFWEEPTLEQFLKNCSPWEGPGICAPKCFGALCEGLHPIGGRPHWSGGKTVRRKEQQTKRHEWTTASSILCSPALLESKKVQELEVKELNWTWEEGRAGGRWV